MGVLGHWLQQRGIMRLDETDSLSRRALIYESDTKFRITNQYGSPDTCIFRIARFMVYLLARCSFRVHRANEDGSQCLSITHLATHDFVATRQW